MPFRSFRDSKQPPTAPPLTPRNLHRALRVVFVLLLIAVLSAFDGGALATRRAQAQEKTSCEFEAGFAELRDLIGAATVGECVERERYHQANGDTFQTTTRGLLIWKKADNWSAFTDGTTTWINGPQGLEHSDAKGVAPANNATREPELGGGGTGSAGSAQKAEMAPRSSSLAVFTSALRDGVQQALAQTHLPGPVPPAGALRTGMRAAPTHAPFAAAPRDGGDPRASPADLSVFRSKSLSPAVPSSFRASVDEPSVSNNGAAVLYTGNWYAAVSGDSGSTFAFLNPFTDFPASFGGFCCDQVTIYDPSRNITIWSLQYRQDGSGNNARRIAVANGQAGVLNNSWFFWDLSAQSISFPPVSNQSGYWLDFGHLELSANFLYVTSNVFGPNAQSAGTIIYRIPLDTLAAHGTLSYSSYYAPAGFSFQPVAGATSTMYWARHLDTSTLRVYQWPESGSAAAITFVDVPHSSFSYGSKNLMTCLAPDATNMCGRDDSRLQAGWLWGSELGFMWDAAQGNGGLGTFPYPYIHVARISSASGALIDEPILWSSALAYAYPGAAVNSSGTLAVSAATGGPAAYPTSTLLLRDEANRGGWESTTLRSGTNGPGDNSWGDYLTARLASGTGPSFVASAFALQGACAGGSLGCATVEPRFAWFGRFRDYPFPPMCTPLPRVVVTASANGAGGLQVNVSTAGTGVFLQSLVFGSATNGVVDIGSQLGVPGNFTANLPAGTQQAAFLVRRAGPGPTTIVVTINDSCGAWPTFVGGGANAF